MRKGPPSPSALRAYWEKQRAGFSLESWLSSSPSRKSFGGGQGAGQDRDKLLRRISDETVADLFSEKSVEADHT